MPAGAPNFDPTAMSFSVRTPLGEDAPLDQTAQAQSAWTRYWWGEEAKHFLDYIFANDRDFREVLNARYSFVNGPLAQFYRYSAGSRCSGNVTYFNYNAPDPLFNPAALPANLLPHDATHWTQVADRGPHAAGLLTMPIFLTKYGSRRGRAHVLYNAFMCRDFIASNVELMPSTEPNLMLRQGCATCHATLEPLASYFTRIVESDWTFLPATNFPLNNMMCANADPTRIPRYCATYYDPAFTTGQRAWLRGAYPDMVGAPAMNATHADQGPAGIAAYLTGSTLFASCAAQNVAASFLGRPLGPDDATLQQSLADSFTQNSYHMRSLVRALVRSDAYRHANDLSSTAWRAAGGGQ
jgi:hypothetical protein